MLVNLKNKRFVILGLQGSGKSHLLRHILQRYPNHLVVDPRREHKGYTRYIPKFIQYSAGAVQEINYVIQKLVKAKKPNLFAIDEANIYAPSRRPLPSGIADLNDASRHYNISFGVIARRPVQLHTDLVELAHYLFIFRLSGKNDRTYLNSLSEGLGDVVAKLPKYHFVLVNENRDYQKMNPISKTLYIDSKNFYTR